RQRRLSGGGVRRLAVGGGGGFGRGGFAQLHIGQSQLVQRVRQQVGFVTGQIAAGLLLQHSQQVDEVPRQRQVLLGFAGLGIGDDAQRDHRLRRKHRHQHREIRRRQLAGRSGRRIRFAGSGSVCRGLVGG